MMIICCCFFLCNGNRFARFFKIFFLFLHKWGFKRGFRFALFLSLFSFSLLQTLISLLFHIILNSNDFFWGCCCSSLLLFGFAFCFINYFFFCCVRSFVVLWCVTCYDLSSSVCLFFSSFSLLTWIYFNWSCLLMLLAPLSFSLFLLNLVSLKGKFFFLFRLFVLYVLLLIILISCRNAINSAAIH